MKKYDKENLIDHSKIFKQVSGVLKYHVDPDICDKFIENTE